MEDLTNNKTIVLEQKYECDLGNSSNLLNKSRPGKNKVGFSVSIDMFPESFKPPKAEIMVNNLPLWEFVR
jgi:hypothetical protein